jgi:hypothetical protein
MCSFGEMTISVRQRETESATRPSQPDFECLWGFSIQIAYALQLRLPHPRTEKLGRREERVGRLGV